MGVAALRLVDGGPPAQILADIAAHGVRITANDGKIFIQVQTLDAGVDDERLAHEPQKGKQPDGCVVDDKGEQHGYQIYAEQCLSDIHLHIFLNNHGGDIRPAAAGVLLEQGGRGHRYGENHHDHFQHRLIGDRRDVGNPQLQQAEQKRGEQGHVDGPDSEFSANAEKAGQNQHQVDRQVECGKAERGDGGEKYGESCYPAEYKVIRQLKKVDYKCHDDDNPRDGPIIADQTAELVFFHS